MGVNPSSQISILLRRVGVSLQLLSLCTADLVDDHHDQATTKSNVPCNEMRLGANWRTSHLGLFLFNIGQVNFRGNCAYGCCG